MITRYIKAIMLISGGLTTTMIYGAFDAPSRRVALLVATASKITFIGLVLSNGSRYLGYSAGIAVAVDAVMVVLFVTYVVTARARESKQYAGV